MADLRYRWGDHAPQESPAPPRATTVALVVAGREVTLSHASMTFDAKHPPWVGRAVRLSLAWGCRVGELAGLSWDRVDLDRGLVELTGKTGPREVPCTPDVVALLEEAPRTTDWVLGVSPGSSRYHLGQRLRRVQDELGIGRFTPHGLRRLAVDRLLRSGVDVGTAAALLGHTPEVMLKAYRQVSLEDRRLGVAALGVPRGGVVPLRRREE